MKRRLILLGGTFSLLLLAFGAYYFLAGVEQYPVDVDNAGSVFVSAKTRPAVTSLPPGESTKNLFSVNRDENGKLQGIYSAQDWEKEPDGTYILTRPKVQLFQKDGQLIIQADRGTIIVEELAGGVNPRKGSLDGNVQVIYDRTVHPDPKAFEDRPEDLIRFYTDHIEFDNDLLQVSTESHVSVFSAEADILGKGLIIRWNDSPRELRTLRILRGELLTIKKSSGGLSLFEPSYEQPTDRNEASEKSNEPAALTDDQVIPPLKASGIFADPSPKESLQATSAPVKVPGTQPSTLPASRPTTSPALLAGTVTSPASTQPAEEPPLASKDQRPPRSNVYRATFHGSVRVDSRNGHIHGADRLAMVFKWSRGQREDLRIKRPTTAATSQTTQPTSQPAAQESPEPIFITWTGELLIEPIDHIEDLSDQSARIAAQGENLVLFDDRIRTTCRELLYFHPQRLGQLTGSETEPVRVVLDGGEEIICGEMRFDGRTGLAHLAGPGYITTGENQELWFAGSSRRGVASQPAVAADSQPTTQPVTADRISWSKWVTARFASKQSSDADGDNSDKIAMTEAIFRGDVKLGEPGSGDFVKGDSMHVWIGDGLESQYPTKAIMTGNVSARQGDSDISAEQITIAFAEYFEKDQSGQIQRTIKPVTVTADGNVRVINHAGTETTTATGDRIIVDVQRDSAILLGAPAEVTQGENLISGPEIHLDGASESASVLGPGRLRFVTDEDFSGRKLQRPQPVNITWSKEMNFDGESDVANFVGRVKFTSNLNSIESQRRMRVTFEKTQKTSVVPRPDRRSEQKSRDTALSMDRFDRRRLATVLADGNVLVLSARKDPQMHLLQRMQLRTGRLFYDAKEGQIDAFQDGTLLVEDYRPPRDVKRSKSSRKITGRTGGMGRPSQTAFEWAKQMQLMLNDRVVIMDGDVKMVHRSAGHVTRPTGLKLLPWNISTKGRSMSLGCGKLMARFAPPDKRTGTSQGGVMEADSVVGDLELFTATRDVTLKDGEYELRGARLRFHRTKGVAFLWGYIEGEPTREAQISQENPITGISRTISSPKFQCFLEDGHIKNAEAIKVEGTGGR